MTVPVLIRIPDLSSQRPTKAVHSRFHARVQPRKRRLKREVRWVGTAMLCGMPLLWGASLIFGGDSPRAASSARSTDAVANPTAAAFHLADPPVVSISLEPAGTPHTEESDAPVVRPAGYILPEDGSEEAIHEGS
jgi:hypothetical protein